VLKAKQHVTFRVIIERNYGVEAFHIAQYLNTMFERNLNMKIDIYRHFSHGVYEYGRWLTEDLKQSICGAFRDYFNNDLVMYHQRFQPLSKDLCTALRAQNEEKNKLQGGEHTLTNDVNTVKNEISKELQNFMYIQLNTRDLYKRNKKFVFSGKYGGQDDIVLALCWALFAHQLKVLGQFNPAQVTRFQWKNRRIWRSSSSNSLIDKLESFFGFLLFHNSIRILSTDPHVFSLSEMLGFTRS